MIIILSRPRGRVGQVPTEARGFWSATSLLSSAPSASSSSKSFCINLYAETYSIAGHSKVFTAKDLDIRLVDAFPSKRGQRYFRLFAHLCGGDRGWKRVVMISKGLVMVMVMVMVLVTMLNLVFAQENLHFQGLIVTFHLVTWHKMLFEIKKIGNYSSLFKFFLNPKN